MNTHSDKTSSIDNHTVDKTFNDHEEIISISSVSSLENMFHILNSVTEPIIKYGTAVDSYLCWQMVKMVAIAVNDSNRSNNSNSDNNSKIIKCLDKLIDQLEKINDLNGISQLKQIYNGDIQSDESIDTPLCPNDVEKFELIKENYRKKIIDIKNNNMKSVGRPMFHLGEIVGARDREKRWWMAKIHEVYEFSIGRFVYLVEFLNWGREYDEVLDEKYIRTYNRWLHTLYKPAYNMMKNNYVINPLNFKQID